VPVATEQNAKKQTIGRDEAIAMARKADEIVAAKGKSVVRLHLKKDKPSDEQIAALIIGPSGNLRAPTLRVGKRLLVGFHDEAYAEVLEV
jgi:arsenate reductase-like glutaredoxin family protein